MNRDSILRRLAALRAKFTTGSNCSPAEVETAMRMYSELKEKYDISDTEEHIRDEGISHSVGGSYKNGKQRDVIVLIVPKIARFTDTRGVSMRTGNICWFGTRPDIEHAQWIFTLVQNALETSWKAYRYSFDYTKLHRSGVHGRTIRDNFRKGFIVNIAMRLDKMIAEKNTKVAGNHLIVVKHELIQAYMDNKGVKSKKHNNKLVLRTKTSALGAGYDEGEKVGLRQTMKNDTKLLENSDA